MTVDFRRPALKLAGMAKRAVNAVLGRIAVFLFRLVRRTDPDRFADFVARLMRRIGPWLPEHRTGRANIAAAFPEKAPAEIEDILRGVWENLGSTAAEYAHLDRLWDYDESRPGSGRIEFSVGSVERFHRLREDGKPALIFAAHLANWEMPALAAAVGGLDTAILYRTPNIGPLATALRELRAGQMGALIPTGPMAPLRLASALEHGTHVAMLVDQHFSQGVDVEFFGRPCKANPMLPRLARHFDCPIHGVRATRLPGHRFRVELTEAVAPIRDVDGDIDAQATMQAITAVIESWVREHPEQWLWLHRRWR